MFFFILSGAALEFTRRNYVEWL